MSDPIHESPADASTSGWRNGDDPDALPQEVRRAFEELDGPIEIRPLSGGLLHQSFHLRGVGVEYVLQRVSDVFASEIHANIQAVTAHLSSKGMPCAPLLPTRDGLSTILIESLGRWRLMPHLGGVSFESLRSVAQARSAGRLVGRFQDVMFDFDGPLAPMGIPYRETARYLAAMQRALDSHRDHRRHPEMASLGERIQTTFADWGAEPEVPQRVIHGDLKLANLLFEGPEPPERDVAFAIVDLDTLMLGTLWMELGDAWRSWCNTTRGASTSARFDMEYFEASLEGFVEGHARRISVADRDSLAMAPERITLELCARFVTDVFEENYFGWDESRFASQGEHNAARAEEQWQLYQAMQETRLEREALLNRLIP